MRGALFEKSFPRSLLKTFRLRAIIRSHAALFFATIIRILLLTNPFLCGTIFKRKKESSSLQL